MSKPIRVQRKRVKGFKLPENTVYVGRPSKWGNPFKVGVFQDDFGKIVCSYSTGRYTKKVADALKRYKNYLKWAKIKGLLDLSELKGKNLACWCKIGKPCHADILLKLANK